ncbi:MAG: FKBP-type peptidyl-prolyl cis-trans isomerase, partial [Thaumarchaeota archaeon]|nr:FKBP-type peptidyl-prolyl cis-trans isomerase [Nitrososphaerota archaeon]
MTVKTGDKVKVDYVGKLDDGSVFDSSEDHGKPLEFQVGTGHVIKGFDDAIVGMS